MSSQIASTAQPQQQQHQQEQQLYRNCILGSHILHYHGVLDAYGHLSFRHPAKPEHFVMPRNMAPANISSPRDLLEYKISDASPVDPSAPGGYVERYIHSEIYKKFPDVNSVIHSHATAVIPYSISGVPMKPCLHMAGFLGASTPVYDISEHYQCDDIRDLLISNINLGTSLASCFVSPHSSSNSSPHEPEHAVALMRGHGYTVVAPTIEECIFRAIYTKENAIIQTTSLGLRMAYHGRDGSVAEIQYLHDDEITGTTAISQTGWSRAWGLWLREVEASHLYVNGKDEW